MLTRLLFLIMTIVLSPALFAASVTTSGAGSPDTNGAYSINWSLGSGESGPFTLKENGATVYSGSGLTKAISGKSTGTYTYQLSGTRRIFIPREGWETLSIGLGNVTVTVQREPNTPINKMHQPAIAMAHIQFLGPSQVAHPRPTNINCIDQRTAAVIPIFTQVHR